LTVVDAVNLGASDALDETMPAAMGRRQFPSAGSASRLHAITNMRAS
jgi:hypothetical protein